MEDKPQEDIVIHRDQNLYKAQSKSNGNWYWGVTPWPNQYKMLYLCPAEPWIKGEEIVQVNAKSGTRYIIPKDRFPESCKTTRSGKIIFSDKNSDDIDFSAHLVTATAPQAPQKRARVEETPSSKSAPAVVNVPQEFTELLSQLVKSNNQMLEFLKEAQRENQRTSDAFIAACAQLAHLGDAILNRNISDVEDDEELPINKI